MRIVLAGGAQLYAQTMPLARQLDITYLRRAVEETRISRPSIAASGTKQRARNMRPRMCACEEDAQRPAAGYFGKEHVGGVPPVTTRRHDAARRYVTTAKAGENTQKNVIRSALRPNQISFSHDQDPKRRYVGSKSRGAASP